jgi:hypothetical protein
MPQRVTLPDDVLPKARAQAETEKVTLSKWVARAVRNELALQRMQIWYKRRDTSTGRVIRLEELDPKKIRREGDSYVQMIGGADWVRVPAEDIVVDGLAMQGRGKGRREHVA